MPFLPMDRGSVDVQWLPARNCSPVFMHINREPSPVRYDSLPKPLMSSIQERREPDDRGKFAPVSLGLDERDKSAPVSLGLDERDKSAPVSLGLAERDKSAPVSLGLAERDKSALVSLGLAERDKSALVSLGLAERDKSAPVSLGLAERDKSALVSLGLAERDKSAPVSLGLAERDKSALVSLGLAERDKSALVSLGLAERDKSAPVSLGSDAGIYDVPSRRSLVKDFRGPSPPAYGSREFLLSSATYGYGSRSHLCSSSSSSLTRAPRTTSSPLHFNRSLSPSIYQSLDRQSQLPAALPTSSYGPQKAPAYIRGGEKPEPEL